MKKVLNDFKSYFDEYDLGDFWTFGESVTFGAMGSLCLTFYFNVASILNKFVSKDKFSPQSSSEDAKGLSLSGSYTLENLVLSIQLLGVLIGSFTGAYRVRNRHQERRRIVELQRKTAMTSNLDELAEEAGKLKDKYGDSFTKTLNSGKKHPRFLCEPESDELMTMPPIVASDGYARGYWEFKRIQEDKLKSRFSGETLAPFGIIDRVLMGNMLAYIQDQPLPTKLMSVSRSKYDVQSMLQFFKGLLKELCVGAKFTAKTIYRDVIYIFTLLSAVCFLFSKPRSPLENHEFIEKYVENAHLLLLASVLLSMAADSNVRSELKNWYESKILLSRTHTNDNDEDIEAVSAELKTESDRVICPITQEMFKRATIVEDGVTYDKTAIETFLEGKPVKKSPITHKEFKNGYPLLWHYTQLQGEVNYIRNQLSTSDHKLQLDRSSGLSVPANLSV